MRKKTDDMQNVAPETFDAEQANVQDAAAAGADAAEQTGATGQVSPAVNTPAIDYEALFNERTNDLQRTRADFENFRKQVDAQKSQAMAVARQATVSKFLPLIDDFMRAIKTYPEQLTPLSKGLETLMKNLELERIDSTPGVEFNPDYHEAISVDPGEGNTEVITEELRPGYLYEKAVLRPAMVKVGHIDTEV